MYDISRAVIEDWSRWTRYGAFATIDEVDELVRCERDIYPVGRSLASENGRVGGLGSSALVVISWWAKRTKGRCICMRPKATTAKETPSGKQANDGQIRGTFARPVVVGLVAKFRRRIYQPFAL
jgi:hypothetical protein